jgi:hypothetical protein
MRFFMTDSFSLMLPRDKPEALAAVVVVDPGDHQVAGMGVGHP